jgi:predicted metalloprotease
LPPAAVTSASFSSEQGSTFADGSSLVVAVSVVVAVVAGGVVAVVAVSVVVVAVVLGVDVDAVAASVVEESEDPQPPRARTPTQATTSGRPRRLFVLSIACSLEPERDRTVARA